MAIQLLTSDKSTAYRLIEYMETFREKAALNKYFCGIKIEYPAIPKFSYDGRSFFYCNEK